MNIWLVVKKKKKKLPRENFERSDKAIPTQTRIEPSSKQVFDRCLSHHK